MVFLYVVEIACGVLLLYILLLCVASLFADPRKEYDRYSPFYRFLLNSATAVAIRLLRIRVHVTGGEKLPADGKILFVGNHCSNFDPIVTWYALKKHRIVYVSKPENFRIPVFGRIIRRCCFLPIDRKDPRNAMVTVERAAELLREQPVSVGIYPEGTRSKTGQLLPFHNGVFKIAQKAGASIAVVCVTGTAHIAGRTPLRATDVYVDIVEVFDSRSIAQTKTSMIGAAVFRSLEKNIEKRNTKWQKDM